MIRYLKTAFSFIHTYILLIFMIGIPILYNYLTNPPLLIIIVEVGIELFVFITYIYGLPKVETFKKRFNEQNYERLINKSYFSKTINHFHNDIKGLLKDFYTEASNIVNELKIDSVNEMVSKSLLNVVQLGESYTSLQEKIYKRMGTLEQRDEMIERNKVRLELIKKSYSELKELGGKLILMDEEGKRDEKYLLQELETMNEALEAEVE